MTPRRDQDTSQIFADFFSSMVSDSHALGLQPVERTDHLQVERWADPHCVGIDQFFYDICSPPAPTCCRARSNPNLAAIFGGITFVFISDSCDQITKPISPGITVWFIFLCTSCYLMQIIQAVAAFRVFTDGDGVKVEKKAPRINYVGFIAPLMTLVSSWIHA